MPIRVLVVDDEPIARRRVRRLLRLEPDVDVIDEVGSGGEAIAAIKQERPDLVLLDVQMPDVDGFGVVGALGAEHMPPTIFVTAFNEYAVRAFDVNAIDYLLKPYDPERFRSAFQRARSHLERISSAEQGRKIRALLEQVLGEDRTSAALADRPAQPMGGQAAMPRTRFLDRLMVKHDGRVFFVKVSDVDWFEASGNYVRVHTGKVSHLIRETMHHVEAQLDPSMFVRIHRAVIVNIDRIKELQPWFAGDYVVILRDGRQLKLSRTYREHLQSRMHRFA
ncbi:MAG: response regulator transcription factor [Gemmatimonadetes bacterium]|jgi:two-component system LytT family response regulator|nr:response regulator transcription factor [Gemmatimonadota bacterium]MBP9107020.1 response regulator transcription factor [Gemmatimonadaceae bacterium]MBK6841549.1 response regulator transcription factor [Gemmatimonadota bacterium]MBK7835231.1 response regulator transcription factor [Gemmatimonadota bacterium]MBK8061644.1 response regulator transcription factor [Gemmatimonadota bacterium]